MKIVDKLIVDQPTSTVVEVEKLIVDQPTSTVVEVEKLISVYDENWFSSFSYFETLDTGVDEPRIEVEEQVFSPSIS